MSVYDNLMKYKVPCGRVMGQSESCSEGMLCEACTEIIHLRRDLAALCLENERLRGALIGWDKAWSEEMQDNPHAQPDLHPLLRRASILGLDALAPSPGLLDEVVGVLTRVSGLYLPESVQITIDALLEKLGRKV